jgi:hypothetical protein
VEGQSARGLRVAISRAATSRGLSVETVEGEGFVAARKVEEPRPRKEKPAPSHEGQRRRGRDCLVAGSGCRGELKGEGRERIDRSRL